MLIGEAPGAQEDQSGVPFTGRSGKALDRMLKEAGFNIDQDIYICNAVKCRPPNNRRPKKNELAAPSHAMEQYHSFIYNMHRHPQERTGVYYTNARIESTELFMYCTNQHK